LTGAHHGQGAPTLYTAEEAAEILRVKKSWLERQAAARKVPFTMLGGAYRFSLAHLVATVQMHEQATDSLTKIRDGGSRARRARMPQPAVSRESALLRPRPRTGRIAPPEHTYP
jgi:excisionase family DNA binding protein